MQSISKTKQQQLLLAIVLIGSFVLIVFLGLWLSDSSAQKLAPGKSEVKEMMEKNYNINSQSAVSDQEHWILKSEQKFSQLMMENKELQGQLAQLENKLRDLEKEQQSPAAKSVVDQVSVQQAAIEVPGLNAPLPAAANTSSSFGQMMGIGSERPAESRGIVQVTVAGDERFKSNKNTQNFLPAGAFAKAVLLSGLDAPTGGLAQTNPMPILMQLQDHGQLPNFFNSNIKSCHVIGAAYGDISAERAMIRLETLSCVLEAEDETDPKVIEVPIKGFVTGEDGKNGLRGKVVSKQGALIARAAMAGVFAGMGSSIVSQYQQISTNALGSVQSLDPKKTSEAGLYTGAANALEKIANFYIARANETYPIIEVAAGRSGEIILTSGTRLDQEAPMGEVKNE